MHILADENIALAREYFAPYGRLSLRAGREIDNASLRDVDVLLVRSVTRVDAALLEGTPVRFVATATSGIDHIDRAYLERRGIGFAAARGCNAEGVVDYVFSTLAALQLERGLDWLQQGIGIVGCGEIGSRLARRLLALGCTIRFYDPFLPESHPLAPHFAPREEVLRQPILTVHVPLTKDGPHPTRHMIDAAVLAALPRAAVFINAARGEVVDEAALLAHCRKHQDFVAVLDAWQNEPRISVELLQVARYGSPHIAGYSYGGKLRGTSMIHAQFCDHFGLDQSLAQLPPSAAPIVLELPETGGALVTMLSQLILRAYDLRNDDAALRAAMQQPDAPKRFDALRRDYPLRREFSEYRVSVGENPALRAAVTGLGMEVLA